MPATEVQPRRRLSQRQREQIRARNAPPPDPTIPQYFLCQRCQRLMWTYGIASECLPCRHASLAVYPGLIQGEVSGA